MPNVPRYERNALDQAWRARAGEGSNRSLEARWQRTDASVKVDALHNQFHVQQVWSVHGATREELMAGVTHLTLTGRHGVYGDRTLITTDTPVHLQNNGRGIHAWAYPSGLPRSMGSLAQTEPTAWGFRATMSGGRLGEGFSDVRIHSTVDGWTRITEVGSYSLSQLKTGFGPLDVGYRVVAATVGRPGLALGHGAMGEIHNQMFNPAEALVNWLNDQRAARARDR